MPSVEESPCPQCKAEGALSLDHQLAASPVGTFSLAGQQMKVSARVRPVLSCSGCDLELIGEYDGRHVVFKPVDAPPPTG